MGPDTGRPVFDCNLPQKQMVLHYTLCLVCFRSYRTTVEETNGQRKERNQVGSVCGENTSRVRASAVWTGANGVPQEQQQLLQEDAARAPIREHGRCRCAKGPPALVAGECGGAMEKAKACREHRPQHRDGEARSGGKAGGQAAAGLSQVCKAP